MFILGVPILLFAICRSERSSTRLFLIGAVLLNMAGAGWMYLAGDTDRFSGTTILN